MATKPKAPAAPSPELTSLAFEGAMTRLEAIVESMESGDIPLAELLEKFEEGSRLVAACEQRLKAAELKIELLRRQKDGSATLEPFAPGSDSLPAA